jgi:hypothetical protein
VALDARDASHFDDQPFTTDVSGESHGTEKTLLLGNLSRDNPGGEGSNLSSGTVRGNWLELAVNGQ